jgi:hypothetical protein
MTDRDLLYGVYERRDDGSLHLLASGQSLTPLAGGGDEWRFRYSDPEMELEFSVTLLLPSARTYFEQGALVDVRAPPYAALQRSYGAWRRTSWFLLDALLAWLEVSGKPHSAVVVHGGWIGGEWRDTVRLRSSMAHNRSAVRARLAEALTDYRPFPLDAAAPTWRWHEGLPGAREGWIATAPAADGSVLADLTVPGEVQLADVPRFVADDGSILFFHRVIPHQGPEYSPGMEYGLLSASHVHYFDATHGVLRGLPVARRPSVGNGLLQKLAEERYVRADGSESPATFPLLHPTLREAQFFAGAEAYGLRFGTSVEDMPYMADLEYGQKMHFGFRLGDIAQAPISVGLPWPHLQSWPRLGREGQAPQAPPPLDWVLRRI